MKGNLAKKVNLLRVCLCIFLYMAVVFLLLARGKANFGIGFSLSLVVVAVLGIVVNVVSLSRKTFFRGALSVILILFLVILLLFLGTPILRTILSCIYTPPTLTAESLTAYNKVIEFLISHDGCESFMLTTDGILDISHSPLSQMSKTHFSGDDITNLCEQLRYLKCGLLKRDNDMVLFYKNANHILPTGSGVLYSLSGKNPNEVNNEALNTARPFFKITGNWYTSRRLITGDRLHPPVYVSGLIDNSLKIDEIDPNQLKMFE